jgi:KUP system potassium uptake protein
MTERLASPPAGAQHPDGSASETAVGHDRPTSVHKQAGLALVIAALGVVFGDIGTSPLYALQTVFTIDDHAVRATPGDVYGVVSLMFWAVTLIVSGKYVMVVMRADNEGEGGVMALVALIRRVLGDSRAHTRAIVLLGVLGASLFYGDTLITPAISVLSAVEGLEVTAPGLADMVLPIAVVILTGLFAVQRWGTGKVGAFFGPIMILWFGALAAAGIGGIVTHPSVIAGLSPTYAVGFIGAHPGIAFVAIGAVVLVITGAEALYADMGHFGRPPIAKAWFFGVFPALTLNYLGQAALILNRPESTSNPFFLLLPHWSRIPMVILATMSTVIASQAVISGAFSVTRQAMQLGFIPALTVRQTSEHEGGQVYLPAVNAALFVGVLALMVSFGSSAKLASAYGFAVTGALLIDTVLLLVVARSLWQWKTWQLALAGIGFGGVEFAFFSGNVVKIAHGGWLPLTIATAVFTVMTTWPRGRTIVLTNRSGQEGLLRDFIEEIHAENVPRVPGTAVFLHPNKITTPLALRANVQHNHVLHEHVLIVSAHAANVPYVAPADRLAVDDLGYDDDGIWHLSVTYGFSEPPTIPAVIADARRTGVLWLPVDPDTASYFLSKATMKITKAPGMNRWRKLLYVGLAQNAANPADVFGLPRDRTVVMGTHVEI